MKSKEKPKERDMGCLCQKCKEFFKMDVNIDDDLWDKIKLTHENLLCPGCIIKRIEQISGFCAFQLVEIK